jgi:hypothetical protein
VAVSGLAQSSETFSNVHHMKEVDSLVGDELYLEEKGGKVKAVLTEYQGNAPVLRVNLAGTSQNRKIHLVSTGEHRMEIDGEILIAEFRGTIKRWIGSDKYEAPVVLKRKLNTDQPCCKS